MKVYKRPPWYRGKRPVVCVLTPLARWSRHREWLELLSEGEPFSPAAWRLLWLMGILGAALVLALLVAVMAGYDMLGLVAFAWAVHAASWVIVIPVAALGVFRAFSGGRGRRFLKLSLRTIERGHDPLLVDLTLAGVGFRAAVALRMVGAGLLTWPALRFLREGLPAVVAAIFLTLDLLVV